MFHLNSLNELAEADVVNTQPANMSSKLTIEVLEQGVKYVQS